MAHCGRIPKWNRLVNEQKGELAILADTEHRVRLKLDKRTLSYFDIESEQWRVDPGDFEVLVGSSSADIRLRGRLSLPETITAKQ